MEFNFFAYLNTTETHKIQTFRFFFHLGAMSVTVLSRIKENVYQLADFQYFKTKTGGVHFYTNACINIQ